VAGDPLVVIALAGKVEISSLKVTEYSIALATCLPTTLEIVGAVVSRITVTLTGAAGPAVEAKSFTELVVRVSVVLPAVLQVIGTV
jgi:hypothetical protein